VTSYIYSGVAPHVESRWIDEGGSTGYDVIARYGMSDSTAF